MSPWLSGIADGECAAAVGGLPADPTAGPVAVAGATGADLFVLGATGPDGPEIHVVGSDRVAVTPVASLDPTRRLGLLEWTPTPDTRVASGPAAEAGMARTSDRAAVATAAALLGLTDRMIGMAADYAKSRHQFGKAIGSFQAVKHMLAGAQVKLEFARPVVYAAAWSLDEGEPTGSRAASAAKALRVGRGHRGGPGVTPGPRGDRLHLGMRSPPVPQTSLGPGRGLGIGLGPPSIGAGFAHRSLLTGPRRVSGTANGLRNGEGVDRHPVVLGRQRREIGAVDHHRQRTTGCRSGIPLDGDDGPVRPHLHDQTDVEGGRRG